MTEEKKAPIQNKRSVRVYISDCIGLKIVIEPRGKSWDPERKAYNDIPGKHIKFENGRFSTSDPSLIKYLDEYCKKDNTVYSMNLRLKEQHKALGEKLKELGEDQSLSEEELLKKEEGKRKPQGRQGVIG